MIGKHGAVHRDGGAVFMVASERGEREFFSLPKLGECLQNAGSFDLDRMRFA
ncbi:hypothetical protein JR064_07300 [Xanthomonas sp. CFBP 8703]|uniref:Uncharacterized protein n=1 Tax=Xanthomonas bonasiae TaxID=2810351 RepID=A0ABS3B023_9XANT|nr:MULTISPECIES: hypothetical protein [Xanthomonas]MBD7924102.1 hypothetical protein [Xanthomonas surreyensis]MBN6101974.1 hypothetical protein [Xanthomonas bonasiae]